MVKRQARSSYIAKRNFIAILFASFGAFCICAVGPIRDIVGRQEYPCAAMMWLRVFGVAFVLLPVSTRMIFFREQMLWSKAKKSISFQKLQEIIATDTSTATQSPRKSIFRFAVNNPKGPTDIAPKESFEDHDSHSELSADRKGISSGASSTDQDEFERLMSRQTFVFKTSAIVLPAVPLVIFGIVYQAALPWHQKNCYGCYEDTIFYLIIGATVGVLVTVTAVVGFLVRKSPDPLGLLYEIKWLIIMAGPFGAAGLLGCLLDQYIDRPYDRGIFSFDWIVLSALIIEFTWLTYVPLYVSYKMKQRVMGARYDFASFLANPKSNKLFAEHLANEWAVENLKFWSQVETFRGQYANFKKVKDANRAAVQIFNTFIRHGAVMDVNIPSFMRDKLTDFFDKHSQSDPDFAAVAIPATVFDEAQREIYNLMEKDSFQRFQATAAFKGFVGENTVLDAAKQRLVVVNPGTIA